MHVITGSCANDLYDNCLWRIRTSAVLEETRNGPALTLQQPAMLTLLNPRQRLVVCPVRDANPFFHLMEFVWMMAGSDNAKWLSQFNRRYMEYSDDGKTVHAGYGARWRWQLGVNQIAKAIEMLRKDPTDRRVVLQMWDAELDLGRDGKDLPCNTQIMLRVIGNKLNMLVTNRSNDLIWGALGANIVHMTMLHEFLAQAIGVELGTYRVVSNNLHMYTGMPRFQEIYDSSPASPFYNTLRSRVPILERAEDAGLFLQACTAFVEGDTDMGFPWLRKVASPMRAIWDSRREADDHQTSMIVDEEWREVCEAWLSRHFPTLSA